MRLLSARFGLCLGVFLLMFSGSIRAQGSESKAERELKTLVERQQTLLARAAKAEDQVEVEDLRPQLQTLVFDYEKYLRDYPREPAGYISYALLLGNPLLDERQRASALLLRANELNPNLPIVKNHPGTYLAEDGRVLDALNYFLAAVQLAPNEALYHFQVGQLLASARDDFLKSGEWTAEQLEKAMRHAFAEATRLAPDNLMYAYRAAESFYDLAEPRWDEALQAWKALEARVQSPVEKQTIRLHMANVLIAQGQRPEAEAILADITEPVLQSQREKLLQELAEAAAADAQRNAPPTS